VVAIAYIGGLFVLFTFTHFVADWIFQTHYEAMNKHKDDGIRAVHCAVYTVFFLPWFWFLSFSLERAGIGAAVLFVSHFVEDSYYPVYLWARYIRRVPEVRERGPSGFVEFISTPLGKILMIAVDQIIHLAFLWVLVALALW
jgi:hypothetical protein